MSDYLQVVERLSETVVDMPEIISELSKYMEENNIETLDEIRGIVG